MADEWVDLTGLVQVAGLAQSADFNSVLQNLSYLYDPPRCAVRLTAAQEVANATDHTISWGQAVWDSHGDMWDAGGPSVVTITRPGVYMFALTDEWADSAAGGKRAARLYRNGTQLRKFHESSADGVSPFAQSSPIITNAAAADSFTVVVRQLSGAALDLVATRTVLNVLWIAAAPVSGE